MPRRFGKNPAYRKHKATGQAVVILSGRDYYLGPHGSPASKAEYDRRVREWNAAGGIPKGEIQPGNQFLRALRLPQVGRQNLRGKRLCFLAWSAIQYSRLSHLDGIDAGHQRPLRQVAIAHDPTMALLVL
jgi:hypothetical protein